MTDFPMDSNPLVSVIIPTYNSEAVISRCVDSVLNQTYDNFEVIIIDDSSTDDTRSVVAGYDVERIIYIYQEENRGPSHARNIGIEAANGKYIAFLDSDDWWVPRKLELQLQELRRTGANVLYSDHFVARGESVKTARTLDVEDPDRHYIDVFNAHHLPFISTILVDVSCLGDIRFNERLKGTEDYHFMVRVFESCRPAKVSEPLAYAWYSPESLSHSNTLRSYKDHSKSLNLLVQEFPELEEYYEEKISTDYWKFSFRFANEGKLSVARQMAMKSIFIRPISVATLPAYGLLASYYLPLGRFRENLLQWGQAAYLRIVRSSSVG